MAKAKTNSIKPKIANFIGAFGYLFCFLQWFWAVILYSGYFKPVAEFLNHNDVSTIPAPIVPVQPMSGLPLTVATVIIVTAMIIFTVYIMFKMPSIILKSSKNVVHETAETAAPIVAKFTHKKETKKLHIKLTARLVVAIKAGLIILAILAMALSKLVEKPVFDYKIVIIIGLWLAGCSIVLFAIQYLIAKLLKVDISKLW